MRQACRVSGFEVNAARVERLRQELDDEQVWTPTDPDLADALLAELDYARHPHAHEGIAPRYGALVVADAGRADVGGSLNIVEVGGVPLAVARRLADGRSSFIVRTLGRDNRLLCFDRTHEHESSAVHLTTATGALVVQRLGRGWVRLASPQGVATWDGLRWAQKLISDRIVERIAPTLPGADPYVLSNLVEFCNHWLGAGRIGTAIVWRLDGDAHQLDGLGFRSSVDIPPLDFTNRSHFAPLLNALSQYDRAALVDGHGRVTTVGVHLRTSEQSRRDIPPFRGTRHTSALRFSADASNAAVFVVSSNGTLSIAWRGQRLETS